MNRIKTMLVPVAMALAASALTLAPAANADPGCFSDHVRRGFLGLTQYARTMCDGPIQPDGSWMRHRVIGTPAHYQVAHSSCSSSTYSSDCYFYPAGWVDEQDIEDQYYPVTPDTVLPDEPGHIG